MNGIASLFLPADALLDGECPCVDATSVCPAGGGTFFALPKKVPKKINLGACAPKNPLVMQGPFYSCNCLLAHLCHSEGKRAAASLLARKPPPPFGRGGPPATVLIKGGCSKLLLQPPSDDSAYRYEASFRS